MSNYLLVDSVTYSTAKHAKQGLTTNVKMLIKFLLKWLARKSLVSLGLSYRRVSKSAVDELIDVVNLVVTMMFSSGS